MKTIEIKKQQLGETILQNSVQIITTIRQQKKKGKTTTTTKLFTTK